MLFFSKQVAAVEEELKDWLNKVEELHSSFKWLLFFQVPKLRKLHELLLEDEASCLQVTSQSLRPGDVTESLIILPEDPHLLNILHEISFLFRNNALARNSLMSIVQVMKL